MPEILAYGWLDISNQLTYLKICVDSDSTRTVNRGLDMAISVKATSAFIESLFRNKATDAQIRTALRALNAAIVEEGSEGGFGELQDELAHILHKTKGLSEETLVEALY